MPQIFHPSTNTISRVTLLLLLVLIVGALALGGTIARSPYFTGAYVVRDQPIPFSHKHHVGEVGLDCRYCHTGAEDSSFAGMPSTSTCLNCHDQLWRDAPMLEPLHESLRTGQPIRWRRLHDLPDFAYFDHSIHVAKGIACVTCHGQVDEMPLMWREVSLHMQWCLDCHRNPEEFVRPREYVFDPRWQPTGAAEEDPHRLLEEYGITTKTDCTVCHR